MVTMSDSTAGVNSYDLDPQRDPRLLPVFKLARGCSYEVGHSHQVARIALRLFDQMTNLHGMDDHDRFRLTAAGILHDIGWMEGQKGHHKTALRYIVTSAELPWNRAERRIIGCVARYHRKALPKISHEHFGSLLPAERETVVKLAAFLRLADGMDRTHCDVVRDLHCVLDDTQVDVHIDAEGRAAAERAVAERKSDLFEQTYQRQIALHWNTVVM